jgi:hypothetical protein
MALPATTVVGNSHNFLNKKEEIDGYSHDN